MSWLNDNRFKIGLVGSVLGIAYLGGRYFDYMDEQQAKSYGAEKKNCGCGKNPCVTYGAETFNADDKYDCVECGSHELRFREYSNPEHNGFFCMNCGHSPCGINETDDKPCTCDIMEYGKYTWLGEMPRTVFPSYLDVEAFKKQEQDKENERIRIVGSKEKLDAIRKSAETFNAMSFKQWSDDEMHEPKHGGSHMQFDDWLDDEIKSHGDIPLSKWGYEEEHDEKEHQHSETFNAESYQVGDEGMFEGGKVQIVAIEDGSDLGKAKVYIYTRLDELGNSDGFIHTADERRFVNQFARFNSPPKCKCKDYTPDFNREKPMDNDDEEEEAVIVPITCDDCGRQGETVYLHGYNEYDDSNLKWFDAESFNAETHNETIYIIKEMDEENEKGYLVGNEHYIRKALNEPYYYSMDALYDDEEKHDMMLEAYQTMSIEKICETLGIPLIFSRKGGFYFTSIQGDANIDVPDYVENRAESFNAETMADRFAKRFPDHKILRDRKGMMAKFRKNQLDDRNWVGWVQLTGYGKQPCILASDLKVGDHIVYNTGASAEVVEIKPKGKATLTVSAISDHDGNTYDRDYRKTAWIPILMSWNIERRANKVKKNAKMMDAESFNAEIDSKYDDVINQLVQSDLVQDYYADDEVTVEYLKEELVENIESGLIVPVGRLKQRLKSAGFKHKNTDPDKYGYGTFHTYEPIKLGNERLTMQLVEGISTQRNEFIPAGYGLLGAYLDDGEKLERVVILKEMEEIEPLMRKIGLLKEGDRIIRDTEYAESSDYCEFKFPSLAGLVKEELGIDMIEWDEENGDLLLTLELNDGLNRRQAHISTPLKREDFDNYRAETFNVESFAAYASADLTKRIREDLKKAFPNLKFSVKKSSGSLGVDVTLMKGDIDFSDLFDDIPYHKRHWERWNDPKPEWTGERSLNQYHFDSYNPKYTELFEKILRIIRGEDWFDHSDAQTDYFHTAYYISMAIGKWNKPYVYDPKLKKGTKPTLESLGGKGMGDAYSQIDFDAESFNAPIVNERYSPQGWSLYGRKLYYQGRQQGSIIGNTSGGFKNEPTSTYAGRQYVRWTPTAMRMAEKAVFDEVSQEHEPQSFEDWMDVIYETNERLNPTSYAFGAETFEAVAVKPKGLEANTPVEKVMLNEYLMNQATREQMRQAIVSDLTMNIGGYKGMRSKILKKQQPKMLTEEYDKRLREEFED